MIELYTVQLARWRLAQSKNIVVVDTTVKSAPKSGYGFLAPSWDIVMGVKSGEITEEAVNEVAESALPSGVNTAWDADTDWIESTDAARTPTTSDRKLKNRNRNRIQTLQSGRFNHRQSP